MEENLDTFDAFCRIIAKLRSPEGCPWDRRQTHHSLKPYLIEEAYEVLQTLEMENTEKLCEELGDLLLQIGLHTQIAEEAGEFAMTDVLRHINEKLIRRHPHVFGDAEISNHEEVSLKWEEIKRMEGEDSKSLLDGIPCNIPALAYSQIIQQRTARIGFDWDTIDGVLEKVTEELEEFRKAETHQQKVHEFGDLMLALSNTARWMGIDLESALQQANQRFCQRFSCMEKISHQRGISMNRLSLTQLDALWEEAKSLLADSHDDDP